jgi:fermentation-respiration switch protein FrsA (DUF1100 family)
MIVLPLVLAVGCVNLDLDSFFFEPEGAYSIEDYHGLPLFQGAGAPAWLDDDAPDRRLYVEVPSAALLSDSMPPEEGDYIHAAFLPAPADCPVSECPLIESGVTFIYQHGNSGNLWRYWYRAVDLWTLGANVLTYTYRGYGISTGEPSRAGILTDAETAMAYLLTRPEVDPERIVAYGYSMGAIPTSHLVGAGDHTEAFAAVVFESGLDSIESVMAEATGADWPTGFFFEDTLFDGPAFLEDGLDIPVLLLWGAQDRRVYREQVERYRQVLAGTADYTEFIGETDDFIDQWMAAAGHRNIPDHAFGAEDQLADYWDDPANPGHCCVHPYEYADPQHEDFLEAVGGTDNAAMADSWEDYKALITGWVGPRFP